MAPLPAPIFQFRELTLISYSAPSGFSLIVALFFFSPYNRRSPLGISYASRLNFARRERSPAKRASVKSGSDKCVRAPRYRRDFVSTGLFSHLGCIILSFLPSGVSSNDRSPPLVPGGGERYIHGDSAARL